MDGTVEGVLLRCHEIRRHMIQSASIGRGIPMRDMFTSTKYGFRFVRAELGG
jgi:hypothetical protein